MYGKLSCRGVEPHGDEQQDREGDERRASVAHKRQRNAHHGHQADGHAHVDQHVEQQDRRHAVAVDASERLLLPFAHAHQPQDQQAQQRQHHDRAEESPLLAHGAEDEVGVLFGDEPVFDLGPFEEALAPEVARADGDFRLVDVVVGSERVADDAQEAQYAVALVLFENRIEDVVGGGQEDERTDEQSQRDEDVGEVRAVGVYGGEDHGREGRCEQAVVEIERSGGDQRHHEAQQDGRQHHRGQEHEARTPLAVHHRLGERADQNQRHRLEL